MIERGIGRRLAAIAGSIAVIGPVLGADVVRAPVLPAGAATEHVVVISIDGLRPDAIERYGAETLERLMREGASSLEARTIHPSKTLPSHTSMLTGQPPETHGISWNSHDSENDVVAVPTVFEMAKEAGHHTAAFFSKAKFRHLVRPGSLDYWQGPESNLTPWMATRTVPDAVDYLKYEKPNLLFVHIGEPDYAGHTIGWMSFAYGWAVKRSDGAVKVLLDAAEAAYGPGNYTVIVTADHGGHGRSHGTDDPQDMTIPWIAWGKGVARGVALPAGIRTMDTAATALWLLGVPTPTPLAGVPVTAAFTVETRAAAAAAMVAAGAPARVGDQ